jgi:hypothetical protein
MYRQEHDDQLSFKDFFLPFGNQLSDNKHCNKLAELIPWYELKDDYVAQFCKNFEAPAKSFRMALCPASTPLAGALHQQIVTRNSCHLVTLRFPRPGQGHSPE